MRTKVYFYKEVLLSQSPCKQFTNCCWMQREYIENKFPFNTTVPRLIENTRYGYTLLYQPNPLLRLSEMFTISMLQWKIIYFLVSHISQIPFLFILFIIFHSCRRQSWHSILTKFINICLHYTSLNKIIFSGHLYHKHNNGRN